MLKMRILIYGAHGWIGKQFVNLLHREDVVFYIGKARVDDVKEVTAGEPNSEFSYDTVNCA